MYSKKFLVRALYFDNLNSQIWWCLPESKVILEKEIIFLPHETCGSSTMFRFLPKSYHWSELCQTPHSIQVPFPSLEIWREREGETERDLSCLATVCPWIPLVERKELPKLPPISIVPIFGQWKTGSEAVGGGRPNEEGEIGGGISQEAPCHVSTKING